MNATIKITKVGNSAAIILPKELLAQLGASQGDMLRVTETEKGLELRLQDDDFEAQMAVAREVMARRKRALRELAK
jgi:putative addiction module antidote